MKKQQNNMTKLLWTGSDVLYATRFIRKLKFPTKKSKLIYMFCMYIFVKIADIFIECHYVVSKHLIRELKCLKFNKEIKVLIDPPIYPIKFKKKKHKGFNILYYRGVGSNQKFNDWIYGYDIIFELRRMDFNIIEVNGEKDMSEIYPIIDFMVRPNRHDGNPRMIMECKINDIPYYWSKKNPNIKQIIKQINEISLQKTQNTI